MKIPMNSKSDEYYMRQAIAQAKKAALYGDVPRIRRL